MECLEKIIKDGNDEKAIAQANGRMKKLSWAAINFFHHITPKVEIFLSQVQSRNLDSEYIHKCVVNFENHITGILIIKLIHYFDINIRIRTFKRINDNVFKDYK